MRVPIKRYVIMRHWEIFIHLFLQLVIRFQQFDLPSPDYDETIDGISCRSGSLDILPYRADINRITLDGRFCGHHSPGLWGSYPLMKNIFFLWSGTRLCKKYSKTRYIPSAAYYDSHFLLVNVTIFSNRVLIRFIAGNYKLDVISKKGFAAEFLIVPASTCHIIHM